jgi:hypothetical protein
MIAAAIGIVLVFVADPADASGKNASRTTSGNKGGAWCTGT